MTRHHYVHGLLGVLSFVLVIELIAVAPDWWLTLVVMGTLLGVGVVMLFLVAAITADYHDA